MNDLEKIYAAKVLNENISLDSVDVSSYRLEDLYNVVKINEAKVTIEFDGGNVKTVEMDNERARKLFMLSDIEDNTTPLLEWISEAGWNTEDAQSLLNPKLNAIYKEGIQLANSQVRKEFYEQIQSLTKRKKNLNILREVLNKGAVDDIYSYLNTKLSSDYPLLVGEDVLKQIGQLAFAEGAVGVGPGEVLISLFTEGKNPDKGDIVLPDGDEVELKASQGRPGKSRVAGLVKRFEKFIQQGHEVVELSPNEINAAKQAIEALKPKVQSPTNKIGRAILDAINSFDPNNIDSVEYVASFIVGSKPRAGVIQKLDPQAYNTLESIGKQVATNKAGASKRGKAWFSTANDQQLIEGLSLFASDDKQQVAKQIISKGLQQGKSMDRVDLALSIAMTFQIAEYYDELKQKFNYYTLFNKDSGLIVSWGPFSDDYVTNAINILNNILSNRDKIVISADSGGRTGYNLSIK
jgi:hypothetical protein